MELCQRPALLPEAGDRHGRPDDFHGTDGPIPVRRIPRQDWLPVYEAFHQSTLDEGFPYDPDMNNPRPPAPALCR